jgi:hypothetical protein
MKDLVFAANVRAALTMLRERRVPAVPWSEEVQAALDRHYVLNMETGEMQEYAVCEQGYTLDGYRTLLAQAGLKLKQVYGGWDGHPAGEADEWFILSSEKAATWGSDL